MLYLQKYLTNFQKHLFGSKKRKLAMWLKISRAQTFSFCYSNVATFPTSWKCKNFNYSLYTVPAEMLYLQKYLTNFQKHLFGSKKRKLAMWLKISSAQTFSFCYSNVTTFPTSWKCKNFNYSLYTVPAEMLYLQKYLTNFQKHLFGSKKRKLAMWLKISSAQTFSFSDGKVTTFAKSWKCKNFNFSLYALREEMPYPQAYLTNFQKLFFFWKKRKLAIAVENYKCTDILVFQ